MEATTTFFVLKVKGKLGKFPLETPDFVADLCMICLLIAWGQEKKYKDNLLDNKHFYFNFNARCISKRISLAPQPSSADVGAVHCNFSHSDEKKK